ncbi:MAG: hypothetical protein R3332_05615 [Pseudohongiellaceae bacterium]|nr:hypothetical protein [Pseudohongiellaceae bacterium]
MRFKLEKPVIIKLLIIGLLFLAAPYLVPMAAEFVIMADIMGLEALVLFLVYQARHALAAAKYRVSLATSNITLTIAALAQAYAFQPKVFLSHSLGSALIITLGLSLLLVFALWLPPLYFSLNAIGAA